jgi:3-isopropylmalate/(R)-2-methylmalate dehydratase small subunit
MPKNDAKDTTVTNTTISGIAAPLPFDNLDTDQIMPKQFLLGIDKSGLAKGVFHDLRMDGTGAPRSDFVLNRPAYRDANILVAGPNFGCGSSREHAVWGLQQAGFKAVIASSFGEIFYFNSIANGFLALILDPSVVAHLMTRAEQGGKFVIDVANQFIETDAGERFSFDLPNRQRRMFLEGLDQIGLTLKESELIDQFEQQHYKTSAWMKIDLPAQAAM